ncbi:hypothetical protein [Corynebacterium minutissimum]|uniref:Uncharacterized protein n=2 Tax=Corynebacterium minutissimum TaxID=38301 RepID=A0A376H061_9CORY|nr:hypothetical protein [Corynebacterium minutissimum]STC77583.1 Uncharacterised protein [Corynebacterium minutissimum]STD79106.1 Uncharacterised protein [Corynebacterium minutissimum]
MHMDGELTGLIGTVAAAVLGVIGARLTARASVDAKKVEAAAPDWDSFTDKIMQRLDSQQNEIDALRSRVETLQSTVEATRRKYWAAIGGLRRIARNSEDVLRIARLPPDVHDDVVNG